MKYLYVIIILIFISSNICLHLKTSQNASCRTQYVYTTYEIIEPSVTSYTKTTTSSYSTTTLITPVTPVTTTVITHVPVVYTYTPVLYYVWKKGKEEVDLSVVHDKDLALFDIKGNLHKKDLINKENWYIHSKTNTRISDAFNACLILHNENRKKNFKNVSDKYVNTIPSFLTPKANIFKVTPKVVVNSNMNDNNKKVITPDTKIKIKVTPVKRTSSKEDELTEGEKKSETSLDTDEVSGLAKPIVVPEKPVSSKPLPPQNEIKPIKLRTKTPDDSKMKKETNEVKEEAKVKEN